jgi:biotin transporter BioY
MWDDIFEIVLEIVLEGAVEAAGSRKTPMLVRILLAALILLVFLGTAGLVLWVGMASENAALAVLGIILLALVGIFVFSKVKQFRNRRG